MNQLPEEGNNPPKKQRPLAHLRNVLFGTDPNPKPDPITTPGVGATPGAQATDPSNTPGTEPEASKKNQTPVSVHQEDEKESKNDPKKDSEDTDESPKIKLDVNPIERTFANVYKYSAYLCVVVFIVIFLITALDIISFMIDYFNQESNLQTDPNMFNKDTHDYSVLQYIKTNTTVDEPYHVFLTEQLYANVFSIVGFVLLMVGFEYGLSIVLSVYNAYSGGNKDYSIDLSPSLRYMIIIGVSLIGATVLHSIYNTYFVNNTQNTMYNIQDSMYTIKNNIYASLTTNQTFLTAMLQDDMTTVIHEFSKSIKNGIQNGDTTDAQNMIFTISIYSYLVSSIPQVDPNYKTVLGIFDYNNIINQNIDPTQFLYYNSTSINIANLYPEIVSLIRNGIQSNNGEQITINPNGDPFFNSENSAQELLYSKFISSITSKITTITQGVTELSVNGISPGKNTLFKYIIFAFFAALIFTIVLIVLVYDEIPDSIKGYVKVIYTHIAEDVSYVANKINILKYLNTKKNN